MTTTFRVARALAVLALMLAAVWAGQSVGPWLEAHAAAARGGLLLLAAAVGGFVLVVVARELAATTAHMERYEKEHREREELAGAERAAIDREVGQLKVLTVDLDKSHAEHARYIEQELTITNIRLARVEGRQITPSVN